MACTRLAVMALGALLLGALLVERAQAADGLPLKLRFAAGVTPCFTSEQLSAAVRERATAAADGAQPAVAVAVAAVPAGGYGVTIETAEPEQEGGARRELTLRCACAELVGPISLVVALMLIPEGGAEPEPEAEAASATEAEPEAATATEAEPEAATATEAEPARSVASGTRWSALRWPIVAAAGAAFGEATATAAVLGLGARMEAGYVQGSSRGFYGMALELRWSPAVATLEAGLPVEVQVMGVQLAGCAGKPLGPLRIELCPGVWLRLLQARLDGVDAPTVSPRGEQPRTEAGVPAQSLDSPAAPTRSDDLVLPGMSLRAVLRAPLGGPLWLFASAEAAAALGSGNLSLRPGFTAVAADTGPSGEPPFFNAEPAPPDDPAPQPGSARDSVRVYEPPAVTGSVQVGVAWDL